ncbi:MAG: hypothetical protein ACXABY_27490, partial [Candidatus Thorarchaeota archaeon]
MTDPEKKELIEAATLDALSEVLLFSQIRSLLYQAASLAEKYNRDICSRIHAVADDLGDANS